MKQQDAPAIVNGLLRRAIERRATDIYWLPRQDGVHVRFRVGGRQEDADHIPATVSDQCLTHLKVLGGALTYRTKVAQDGIIRYDRDGLQAELRLATMPTQFGERIALRLLDQQEVPLTLDQLHFPDQSLAALRRLLAQETGLIVLTGPTGCGKTTTIYAMIRELLDHDQDPASIITIEDPIERVVPEISQSAVSRDNESWDYPTALRAALRQDVKTLIVGEMRDAGVVKVVLDAALTGHRVITTYHAGEVAAVYARMLHQGFEPFLIASAITGVVAQRLVPGTDGSRVPVVAVLEPDDPWRDFIAAFPALADVRREVKKRPQASLEAAAKALHQAGRISRETALRMQEG